MEPEDQRQANLAKWGAIRGERITYARELAARLVAVADELRLGDGTALGCALDLVATAARDAGLLDVEFPASLKASTRAVFDRDGWECQWCGSHRNLTVDHIHPVSKGGTNEFDNLQTLCGSCNSAKGARIGVGPRG